MWWQSATIYQVYPRSFQDADGDGIGDLKGIAQRLPYLRELGVDAVWISPIFPSPMADFGYDISNYTDIEPLFGSMSDFDALLAHAHELGLRVILDFVPNHTSEQHPWFIDSRLARSSPRRDWYIWRDPASDGGPPNNWMSEFGGSAWEWDAATGQYYYHAFLKDQPDLNWRNPAVREAMHEAMRFWLRKGVAGFRVDVIWHLIKDDQFRDNPPNTNYRAGLPPHQAVVPLYTADLPEVHDVINGLRRVVDEFPDRLLIGEIYLPVEKLVAYYGRDLTGAHLPFNFSLLETSWHARTIAKLIDDYEAALPRGGWPNWVLGNHDRPRVATRVGESQARVAAMLLLTLRGTPTIYYGDEIGMQQAIIAPEDVQDPFEKNVPGLGVGRDGARTPMQWDSSVFAGFSTQRPWLPVAPDASGCNVAAQTADATSILALYRRLIAVRKGSEALLRGHYRPVAATGDILLYVREAGDERILVALNLGHEPMRVSFPRAELRGKVLVSCWQDRDDDDVADWITLRPDEGLIIRLSAAATPLEATVAATLS
jgi:alpha-glucosidase